MEHYELVLGEMLGSNKFDRVHAVLVTDDERVLLRYKNGEARITGGRIDEGETDLLETLRREIREEINCEIDRASYLGYLKVMGENSGKQEYWARMVARVTKIFPAEPDPDREHNWIYGRVLASIEQAHDEIMQSMPLGDTEALFAAAIETARREGFFTKTPNLQYEVLNLESHDEK